MGAPLAHIFMVNPKFTLFGNDRYGVETGSMKMIVMLSAALAAQVLPQIDRASLDLMAKAEQIQPRPVRAKAVAKTGARHALKINDLPTVATICNAAARQSDPAGFISTLGTAFSLSRGEESALRETCATFLAGRAYSASVRKASR